MKVSVLLTTYNHEKYIAQAIDSALTQETNFDYEIVIIEDCSTDGTRDIVISYQKRYPEKIRLVLAEKNECDNTAFAAAFQASPARYIALLDGDDYWTSPHKLQRQAEFLDAHSECVLCFHKVAVVYQDGSAADWNPTPGDQKEISTLEDLVTSNFVPACSAMLRKGVLSEFPGWYSTCRWGDWPLYILHAQYGKIGYINEAMGAYRFHSGGFYAGLSKTRKLEEIIGFLEDMDANLSFKYTEPIQTSIRQYRRELAREMAKAAESEARLQWRRKGVRYQHFVDRVRGVVRTTVPPEATVIVISNGDSELLQLDGRRAWRFFAPMIGNGGSEQLFAGGSRGSQEAPWINADKEYEFHLYSGTEQKRLLATTRVTRSDEAFLIATPNPVPTGGAGPGTTTVSWSTGDASEGQVYVSDPYYPADSVEAINQLEALREKGADFLLFPSTAFWWLEHYREFKQHLESRYQVVARQEDACVVYALQESETTQLDGAQSIEEVVDQQWNGAITHASNTSSKRSLILDETGPKKFTSNVLKTVAKPNSNGSVLSKRILVLGISLAGTQNNVEHIVTTLSESERYNLTQRWVAVDGEPTTKSVAEITVKLVSGKIDKMQTVNELLAQEDVAQYEYVLLIDDDIVLPDCFLDQFIPLQADLGFSVAQPALTSNSYIDYPIVERQRGVIARQTLFVERGPVVSFHNSVYNLVFPFEAPNPLSGGYERVWSYLLAKYNLKMGIIDIVPVERSLRKPPADCSWDLEDREPTTGLEDHRYFSYEQCFRVLDVIASPRKGQRQVQ